MKRMILLVATVLLVSGAAYAHGKQQHVMGTVTAPQGGNVTRGQVDLGEDATFVLQRSREKRTKRTDQVPETSNLHGQNEFTLMD
jgi:hypothetical protein